MKINKLWRNNLVSSAIICVLGLTGFCISTLVMGCSDEKPVGELYEDGTYTPNNELKLGVKYNYVYPSSFGGSFYRIKLDKHIYIIRSCGYQGGVVPRS